MHKNIYLSPLAVCMALTMASSAKAAEPIQTQKLSMDALQQTFQLVSPGQSALKALNQQDALQLVQSNTDKFSVNHLRMQQFYAGFKVIGGYTILHSKAPVHTVMGLKKGLTAPVQMNGRVYKNLSSDLGEPDAGFVARAKEALIQFKSTHASKNITEESVTPLVYVDAQHKAHWAYQVTLSIESSHQIPEKPTAILDATTFKPYVAWNDIKTVKKPAKAQGYGGNPKLGEYLYGDGYPTLDILRDAKRKMCYMSNSQVTVVDMKHKYTSTSRRPMQFKCVDEIYAGSDTYWTGYESDGYDKINGAFSPSNDALYIGYVIKHMYLDWYNTEPLVKKDKKPMQLLMRVHYGSDYENAFWDGKQMTYGDGEDMMYPLVSMGVGAHEVSHGFTEQHAGLEYNGHSGGMNEAFSDMAAQAAEFYSTGNNTWMIGSEIMKEGSGYEALRYMDQPSKDGRSIDSADDYEDGLDVHYSSGVYNRLFYTLATSEGWDTRKAFDVMVNANMNYWTPYSTFDEGGCGVLSSATALSYNLDDVEDALDEVGINIDECRRPDEVR